MQGGNAQFFERSPRSIIPGQTSLFGHTTFPRQKLHWNRSDTDLLELVTALYEANAIKTESGNFSKKELQNALEWMFNHPVKGAGSKLTKVRERKNEPSVFMDELKQAFSRYVLRKDAEVHRRRK